MATRPAGQAQTTPALGKRGCRSWFSALLRTARLVERGSFFLLRVDAFSGRIVTPYGFIYGPAHAFRGLNSPHMSVPTKDRHGGAVADKEPPRSTPIIIYRTNGVVLFRPGADANFPIGVINPF